MERRTITGTHTSEDGGKHPWEAAYHVKPTGALVWDSWLLDEDGKRALMMTGGTSLPTGPSSIAEYVVRTMVESELSDDLRRNKERWPCVR
jgi:hypothetical protein